MTDPNPHYINELQSDLRCVKEGWYAIDERGNLLVGPFSNRENCLSGIIQSANWAAFKHQPIVAFESRHRLLTAPLCVSALAVFAGIAADARPQHPKHANRPRRRGDRISVAMSASGT